MRVRAGGARDSRRRGDGVQVLHQALEVGHLLGQLVRLVALGERNRVTAGGGGGAGGEGGKHLEGEREREREIGGGRGREKKRKERRKRVSQGFFTEDTGGGGWGVGVAWLGTKRAGGGWEGREGGVCGVRDTEEAKTFRNKEQPTATKWSKEPIEEGSTEEEHRVKIKMTK